MPTAPNAELRLGTDAGLLRDLVRRGKADAGNVLCQLVRILLEHHVHALAVGLPDLEGHTIGDAVLLQEEHGVPQIPLFRHERGDLPGLALADALNLRQPLGLLVHAPESLIAKFLDNSGRQRLSDALDRARRQVAQHGLRILGRDHAIGVHLELLSVDGVLHDFTGHNAALALADGRRKAGAGQDAVLPVHLKYGICILFISVNDMFYISLEFLHATHYFRGAPCSVCYLPLRALSLSSILWM